MSSPVCSYEKDRVSWGVENINIPRKFYRETRGYQVLQGKGKVQGRLLGGCADVFWELLGTSLWPSLEQWRDTIVFLETSEMDMPAYMLCGLLRNLGTQGIFHVIKGILVGKPAFEDKLEIYDKVYQQVIGKEYHEPSLPIISNVNFGHGEPIGIIPYGLMCEMDVDAKRITILEPMTK